MIGPETISVLEAEDERRLTTIMAVDVVGYSRLMSDDEGGTLAALQDLRRTIVEPLVAQYGGRIFKLMGDGALMEFPSVVKAVQCAVEIQKAVAARPSDWPDGRKIELRIGINLGDVIALGSDLYGSGVNLAARLQALAPAGGICISSTVHEHVGGNLTWGWRDMGEQTVKNIARPLRVYGLIPAQAKATAAETSARARPSVAVLPFANMSGDPEQEFFAEGLTEEILTELSRFRGLLVISRNSTFKYKGKPIDIREVSRDLGADYVVEGSVRKTADRVRVIVQLIDGRTDQHIWADRYDRKLTDIFEIQDEITTAIVATLPGRIEAATRDIVARKKTDNMVAYECVLAGKILHHRSTREANTEALVMLNRALELDPNYAHAHAWKACTVGQAWVHGWCADADAAWATVNRELEIAMSLDDHDSDVHRVYAAVCLARDDHEQAMYHQERALALNPNDDLIVVQQGEMLTWMGKPEEGITWILKAMRLNPYHPERFWNHLGRAYFVAQRYQDAIGAFRRITAPDQYHFAFMAAIEAKLGNLAAAAQYVKEVLSRDSSFSSTAYIATLHYKGLEDREHHYDALLAAGLPK
jgi:adenylate cyclase